MQIDRSVRIGMHCDEFSAHYTHSRLMMNFHLKPIRGRRQISANRTNSLQYLNLSTTSRTFCDNRRKHKNETGDCTGNRQQKMDKSRHAKRWLAAND